MTLPELLHFLDQYQERIPLDVLDRELGKVEVNMDDLDYFIRFGEVSYRRNLLYEGTNFMALVLCWRNGQRSAIHDHSGSTCGVKVLTGTVTETVFVSDGDQLRASATRVMEEGSVCATQDADVHQLSNFDPAGRDLVTLHIYSPPLLKMNVYSLSDKTMKQEVEAVYDVGSRLMPKLSAAALQRE